MNTHGFAIFCDDIRIELGNKSSLMGIYNGELLSDNFPLLLPKLCVHASLNVPLDRPLTTLSINLYQGDEIVRSSEIGSDELVGMQKQILTTVDPEMPFRFFGVTTQITLLPFHTDSPVILKLVFVADGEEVIAGKLRIKYSEPPSNKS